MIGVRIEYCRRRAMLARSQEMAGQFGSQHPVVLQNRRSRIDMIGTTCYATQTSAPATLSTYPQRHLWVEQTTPIDEGLPAVMH